MSKKVTKAAQAISEIEGDRSLTPAAKAQALRAIARHIAGLLHKLESSDPDRNRRPE